MSLNREQNNPIFSDAILKSMKTYKTFRSLILCFTNIYLFSFLRLVEFILNHAHCCPLTLLVVIRNRFQVKSVIHKRDSFSACIANALDYWGSFRRQNTGEVCHCIDDWEWVGLLSMSSAVPIFWHINKGNRWLLSHLLRLSSTVLRFRFFDQSRV